MFSMRKAEIGKTTIATNIVAAYALTGEPMLFVNADHEVAPWHRLRRRDRVAIHSLAKRTIRLGDKRIK
jgi:MinD-like ATPase involved in chromosome partitioning or flagellar assembly